MSRTGDRLFRLASASVPATAAVAIGACLLPPDTLALILTAVLAWTCASVPIGVLVGHCTLNGD